MLQQNDPTRLMRSFNLEPDPWQLEVLEGSHQRLLLNCSRQAGKSTTVAILALANALWNAGSLTLMLSRTFRQASELFGIVTELHTRAREPLLARRNAEELVFKHGSRIVCLPCKEETIRGYSNVSMMIIDEAARVPDDLYRAVRPMLAVSNGRLICLSTPYGKRGFFWQEWSAGGDAWHRIELPANQCPRIKPEFLEEERIHLGEQWFRQEYFCSFESVKGRVFPNFEKCVVKCSPSPPASGGCQPSEFGLLGLLNVGTKLLASLGLTQVVPTTGKKVGGIDFGFRNPFAAVWGILDHRNVLWLTHEHYGRGKALSEHLRQLPRDVTWYVDPSGANERTEMRIQGFNAIPGDNAIRPGISKIAARLDAGMLKVIEGACPNLLAEAGLYCWGEGAADKKAEAPIDEHNHAISALRYLLSRIDARGLKKKREEEPAEKPKPKETPGRDAWCNLENEALWTRIWPP